MTTLTETAPVRTRTIETSATETYAIDPSHSRIGFVVRHLGFSKVYGSFNEFEGEIEFGGDDVRSLKADATIESASVSTGEVKRDDHLRSADFFDVEQYPEITFQSTDVRPLGDDRFILVGDFTLHGVTRTIELTGEFLGESGDPWGGTRVGFEAGTKINRKDYGLNWNVALEAGGLLVGDEVELNLEIQAVRQ